MSCPICSCCAGCWDCCCPTEAKDKYPHIKYKLPRQLNFDFDEEAPDMESLVPFAKLFQLPQPQSELPYHPYQQKLPQPQSELPYCPHQQKLPQPQSELPYHPHQQEVVTQQPVSSERRQSFSSVHSTRRMSDISVASSEFSESTVPDHERTNPLILYEEPVLQFSIYYDIQRCTLSVHLQQASNLPAMDKGGTSDPFVTLHLDPNKVEMFESKVVNRTLNPVFDQVFEFKNLQVKEIHRQSLVLAIYDHDRFSKNDFIGSVVLPLREADLLGATVQMAIEDIDIFKDGSKGNLLLSLTYQPEQRLIHGIILRATNLKKQDVIGLADPYDHAFLLCLFPADPYVKVYLLHKGKKQSKWKTKVKKNTLSAVFNESFQFHTAKRDINLKDVSLDFVVMDHDRFSRDDKIGIVTIGELSAHESGRKHWADMLSSPGHAVSQWHLICPYRTVR